MSKRRPPRTSAASRSHGRNDELVDAPSQRLQAARGLWDEGRRNDAIALFEEAVRQEPNNVRAYVLAARAQAERFEFGRMDDIHARLVRKAPRHPGVHHYLGETYGLLKLPERAIASYRHAAELPGAGPPTWMELAALFERAHRLDEAEELIERTVKSGFDLPLVGIVRGRVQRRQKRYAEAEATYRDALARMPEESEWACLAWGELALMQDSQDDFAGALDAIERCKTIQRRHAARFRAGSERIDRETRELAETVTRTHFERWQRECDDSRPTALLSGFPRSGTTLLEQILDAHPGLVSSEERDFVGSEFHYLVRARRGGGAYVDALDALPAEELRRQRERYLRGMEYLLGEPIGDRLHLDKNPAYGPMVPLVLRLFPAARVLTAIRDPRDVVLSCYLRYLPLNTVSVRFLDPESAARRYATDMSAWLRFREALPGPWCEVRYEDTVADLERQARNVVAALDLPWDESVLAYRDRLSATSNVKHVTSPSYESVAQPIYRRSIGRWENYAKAMEPALPVLAPFLQEFGYN